MSKPLSSKADELTERMLAAVDRNYMLIFDTTITAFRASTGQHEKQHTHRAAVYNRPNGGGNLMYTLQNGMLSGTKIGKRNQARLEKAYIEAGRAEMKRSEI